MVSGQFPKHMGWSDEAFRDVDNVLGFGAERHRHRPATSATPTTSSSIRGRGDYPKLGDYLHAQVPRHDRRQRRPEGLPGRVDGRRELRLSTCAWAADEGRRHPALTRPRAVGRHVPRPVRATCRPTSRTTPATSSASGTTIASSPAGDYYGTKTDKPAWLYPEDGRYVPGPYRRPRERRRLGRRRGHGDHGERGLVGHVRHTSARIDKIGHMWGGGVGRQPRELHLGSELDVRLGPHAVRRQERRRPARHASSPSSRSSASSTTP